MPQLLVRRSKKYSFKAFSYLKKTFRGLCIIRLLKPLKIVPLDQIVELYGSSLQVQDQSSKLKTATPHKLEKTDQNTFKRDHMLGWKFNHSHKTLTWVGLYSSWSGLLDPFRQQMSIPNGFLRITARGN